jgi:hypothetical protein
MRTILAFAVAAIAAATAAAPAAGESRSVGDWRLHIERDHFSDRANMIAVATSNEWRSGLSVRCLSGRLSVALAELDRAFPFDAGAVFDVMIRPDRGAVFATAAVALSDQLIEVEPKAGLVRAIVPASEIAVRIKTPNMSVDRVFRVRGAGEALAPVIAACHVE